MNNLEQFNSKTDEVLYTIKKGFNDLSEQITEVHRITENIEKEVVTIRATMIDKDYLDSKIAELCNEFS